MSLKEMILEGTSKEAFVTELVDQFDRFQQRLLEVEEIQVFIWTRDDDDPPDAAGIIVEGSIYLEVLRHIKAAANDANRGSIDETQCAPRCAYSLILATMALSGV